MRLSNPVRATCPWKGPPRPTTPPPRSCLWTLAWALAVAAPLLGVGAARAEHSPAALARHLRALAKKLPSDAFTVVVVKPFVVVGDLPVDELRRWAHGTVRWAVGKLKALYFERDPAHILDVWLFKDAASYRGHSKRLFGEGPSTPYGYYSPRHHALVMNISTGGGTLVHELVHPFMEANFADVPAWFNEGLGSLYEQSAERRGILWGLPNWRLAGLQKLIRAGKLPTFRALLRQDDDAFYADRRGDNYAQARYLCLYLQERGLLQKFYRAYHAARATDPTGYKTLRQTLGLENEAQMGVFLRRWAKWVLTLEFP